MNQFYLAFIYHAAGLILVIFLSILWRGQHIFSSFLETFESHFRTILFSVVQTILGQRSSTFHFLILTSSHTKIPGQTGGSHIETYQVCMESGVQSPISLMIS